MVAELPFDVSAVPELERLADEVRRTHRPRLLRRGNEDIALLLPLPSGNTDPRRRSTRRPGNESVVARTAGALRSNVPFPGIVEEKRAFEQAVADDVRSRLGD